MEWASYQIRKIEGCACVGNVWNVFPAMRVSNPGMHHGTCVMYVPWCMPGSLTSGFLWRRWRGKRSRHLHAQPTIFAYIVSGKRPMATPWHAPYTSIKVSCCHKTKVFHSLPIHQCPSNRLNIKTPCYQYNDSLYKCKTASRLPYIQSGNPYLERRSLFWNRALFPRRLIGQTFKSPSECNLLVSGGNCAQYWGPSSVFELLAKSIR